MKPLYVFAVTAYVLSAIAAGLCAYGVSGLKRSGWLSKRSILDWFSILLGLLCLYVVYIAGTQLPLGIAILTILLGVVSGLAWLRYRLRTLGKGGPWDWLSILLGLLSLYWVYVADTQAPLRIASLTILLGLVLGIAWLRYRLRTLRKLTSSPRGGPEQR